MQDECDLVRTRPPQKIVLVGRATQHAAVGVQIQDLAELSCLEQHAEPLDGRIETVNRVGADQAPAACLSQPQERPGLLRHLRRNTLDVHVLVGLERRIHQICTCRDRRSDHDRVELLVLEQVGESRRVPHAARSRQRRQQRSPFAAEPPQVAFRETVDRSSQFLGGGQSADDAHRDRGSHVRRILRARLHATSTQPSAVAIANASPIRLRSSPGTAK